MVDHVKRDCVLVFRAIVMEARWRCFNQIKLSEKKKGAADRVKLQWKPASCVDK